MGYRRARRHVGVRWEVAGDEAAWSDGEQTRIGADPWVYGELVDQPLVQTWLAQQDINLGSADQQVTHWLVVDRQANRGYVSERRPSRIGTSRAKPHARQAFSATIWRDKERL